MAITFPRALYDCKFQSVTFDLQRFIAQNALYGGQTQVRQMAEPRWVAEFVTAPLSHAEVRPWRAWWDSLKGGLKEITVYDPYSPYPAAYRGWGALTVGGSPFNGTADVTALTSTTIALASLPANFVFTAGDSIGLVQSVYQGLYRVLESITANGSGVVTVTVEPEILTGIFTATAVAHLYRPTCIMIPLAESWSAPRGVDAQPISFSAIQKLA